MPALLNSSGTSSHSLGRTLCRGVTYSHFSSSADDIGFLCCTAGAECALAESFKAAATLCDLNLPPLPNSGRLVAVANRACADAAMAVAAMGLMEPLLHEADPSGSLLLLPVVEEGVHGSEVVPIG